MKGETHLITTGRRGIAMLSALGVLIILGLLSNAFSAHMRLAYAFAMKDAQNLKAQYLAVAGTQEAIARIKNDSLLVDSYVDTWWSGDNPERVSLGKGGYTVRLSNH